MKYEEQVPKEEKIISEIQSFDEPDPRESIPGYVDLCDLFSLPPHQETWIASHLVSEGRLVSLVGPAKSGKSLLALNCAAPNPIEIISITESSSTSVEILFNSNLPKKQLSYYVINAAIELQLGGLQNSKSQNVVAIAPKSIKKVIKTKATGLITAQIKNLNTKATYNFSISAKTNKGKMISSALVEYSPLSNLMDVLFNLPADWGNPTQTE